MTDSAFDKLTLSIENIEPIYQCLISASRKAARFYQQFDLDEDIQTSADNRDRCCDIISHQAAYAKEIAPIHSFLNALGDVDVTPAQRKTIIASQALCKRLRNSSGELTEWALKGKQRCDEAGCKIPEKSPGGFFDDTPLVDAPRYEHAKLQDIRSVHSNSAMVDEYLAWRGTIKPLHQDFMYDDIDFMKGMMETCARRLDLSHGPNTLCVETGHEMDVFVDYGLFQYRENGKHLLTRFYERRHHLYEGKALQALQALKHVRFSLLDLIEPMCEEGGLIVEDRLHGGHYLLIDNGLAQTAAREERYAVLTHYLCPSDFIMTTGASTPIAIDTAAGQDMQDIFAKLVVHQQQGKPLKSADYYQAITDLYKIAFHGNVTKTVQSDGLPMGAC